MQTLHTSALWVANSELLVPMKPQGIPELMLRDATDADLEQFEGLTGLRFIGLANTKVTDAGLAYLEGLTGLTHLDLSNTKVTDAGLEHLMGLTALQQLDLSGTKVTAAGIAQLKAALPNVEVTK